MREKNGIRLLLCGGGTGGHLFPGIAVAEEIRNRLPQSEILFVGTGRQIEANALKNRDFKLATIRCDALKGTRSWERLLALGRLPLSLLDARKILRSFNPHLVLGVGGYVTGPVSLCARMMGIPTVIHEQNSVPGVTNRILGRVVNKVLVSLPGSERYFPPGKALLTGNPVRTELLRAAKEPRKSAEAQTLLILGGSQGAHRLNTLVLETFTQCGKELPPGLQVIHQTGAADETWVRQGYKGLGIQARVAAFFTDMAAIYQQADLVVSRAGATTLAELTVLGKVAIFVPYPFAADGHQELNARYVVEGGGARMFVEHTLTEEKLADELKTLLNNRDLLATMSANAARLGRPEATTVIVDTCLGLL